MDKLLISFELINKVFTLRKKYWIRFHWRHLNALIFKKRER